MRRILLVVIALLIAGCATEPSPGVFVVTPERLTLRQSETRRYDGISGEDLFIAGANVLQDLGYTIDKSESTLMILTASKKRNATDVGQVALSMFFAFFGGIATPINEDQTIRVTLVVRPVLDASHNEMPKSHYARCSFQRMVRLSNGEMWGEPLTDPAIHQQFHDKLSKSVFLEAQKI